MIRVHRFLAMLLMVCLNFQVAASTLAELCRFECEHIIQSELIAIGSVSEDEVVVKPEQGIREVTAAVQGDDQARSGMSCEGCSSCQECMPSIALIPSFNPQLRLFKEHLELPEAEHVFPGESERPYKPPR